MAHWRDRLAVAPLWLWAIIFTIVGGMPIGVLAWWIAREFNELAAVCAGVLIGIFVGGACTIRFAGIRRSNRAVLSVTEVATRRELVRALRTGEPPPGPALDQDVLALGERNRLLLQRLTTRGPLLTGVALVLAILNALLNGIWPWLGIAIALIPLYFLVWLMVRRANSRLDRLETAIRARAGQNRA